MSNRTLCVDNPGNLLRCNGISPSSLSHRRRVYSNKGDPKFFLRFNSVLRGSSETSHSLIIKPERRCLQTNRGVYYLGVVFDRNLSQHVAVGWQTAYLVCFYPGQESGICYALFKPSDLSNLQHPQVSSAQQPCKFEDDEKECLPKCLM